MAGIFACRFNSDRVAVVLESSLFAHRTLSGWMFRVVLLPYPAKVLGRSTPRYYRVPKYLPGNRYHWHFNWFTAGTYHHLWFWLFVGKLEPVFHFLNHIFSAIRSFCRNIALVMFAGATINGCNRLPTLHNLDVAKAVYQRTFCIGEVNMTSLMRRHLASIRSGII